MSEVVKKILSNYESDNPGTKANLYRLLNTGKLAGTGKLLILPVDQGFEHGPERSFAKNPDAYDPHYHFQLAIDAGLNAYAAPLGMLEAGASTFAGQIPTILKVNSNNSLCNEPNQSINASVDDAIRLGCSAIGFTIYPAADASLEMFEEISAMAEEAKAKGLVVVIWSYPRGTGVSKDNETAVDLVSYAAHIACLLGAHIIKVKPPKNVFFDTKAQKAFEENGIFTETLSSRIAVIKRSCFNGRRIVIFSGGESKNDTELFEEINQIHLGGGNGSIIGRNTFQRKREDALAMLKKIIGIYS
jgi:class I fructose-bisphosphate aldolase